MLQRWYIRRILIFPLQLLALAMVYSAIFLVQIETTIRAEIAEQVHSSVFITKSTSGGGNALTPAQQAEALQASLEKAWGLDQPWPLRIVTRALDLATFQLGRSTSSQTRTPEHRREVGLVILDYLPASLLLYGLGGTFSVVLGLALGLRAAWRHRGPLDRSIDVASPLFGSTPSWWIAMLLVMFLVFRWPILSYGDPSKPANLVIPLVSIVLTRCWSFAFVARQVARTVLAEEWVAALRARGISGRRILGRHVLKACGGPFLAMGGMQILQLVSTEFVLEPILLYPGIGSLLAKAVMGHDIALACGLLMCFSVVYLVVNLAIDLAHGRLDPRISRGKALP